MSTFLRSGTRVKTALFSPQVTTESLKGRFYAFFSFHFPGSNTEQGTGQPPNRHLLWLLVVVGAGVVAAVEMVGRALLRRHLAKWVL